MALVCGVLYVKCLHVVFHYLSQVVEINGFGMWTTDKDPFMSIIIVSIVDTSVK